MMAEYTGKGDSPKQVTKLYDKLDIASPIRVSQVPVVVQRLECFPEAKYRGNKELVELKTSLLVVRT
jgi:hypothetical protein